MFNAKIKVRKEYVNYNFDDGKSLEGQGIKIIVAPKIEKFIMLENITTGNKSNLELIELCNPNLAQWYHNSPVGQEMDLIEHAEKIQVKSSITDVYKEQSNEL